MHIDRFPGHVRIDFLKYHVTYRQKIRTLSLSSKFRRSYTKRVQLNSVLQRIQFRFTFLKMNILKMNMHACYDSKLAKISRIMMHQRNQRIHSENGFVGSSDAP